MVAVQRGQVRSRRCHFERRSRFNQEGDSPPEHLLSAAEGGRHVELPALVSRRDVRRDVCPCVPGTDPPLTSTGSGELLRHELGIARCGYRHVNQ